MEHPGHHTHFDHDRSGKSSTEGSAKRARVEFPD